jgi:hypothetical protein
MDLRRLTCLLREARLTWMLVFGFAAVVGLALRVAG